jgi:phage-related tail fiber protein
MIDANSQFFAILTNVGLAKQANADALGVPWKITEMGVGDANLTDPIPAATQTHLINEWRRRPLNQLKVDALDPSIIIAEQIIPADEGGRWIREIGLYDADGDLVAVANCAPSYKPLLSQGSGRTQVVRMNFIVNNSGNITLKIDPAVVLASRSYVDAAILEVLPKNKTPGEFTRVKISDRGLVVSGDNPSTLAGMGITDSFTKTETTAAIKGALAIPVVTVSASKALVPAELGLVLIGAETVAVTVDLPTSNGALGVRDVVVRRTDNTGNRLVVRAAGTDKIKFHTHLRAEGYPFLVLMGAGDYWHLRSDGAGNWFPVARFDNTPLGRPVFETITAFSPGGWVGQNGFLYSRAEWPWAWDHAQASGMLVTEAARLNNEGCWTSGDGATTFRSPEGRGEFMRVLDEARGVDPGRVAGSRQRGTLISYDDAYTGWSVDVVRSASPGETGGDVVNVAAEYPSVVNSYTATGVTNGGAPSATVARPRNIAYPGRIKLI